MRWENAGLPNPDPARAVCSNEKALPGPSSKELEKRRRAELKKASAVERLHARSEALRLEAVNKIRAKLGKPPF